MTAHTPSQTSKQRPARARTRALAQARRERELRPRKTDLFKSRQVRLKVSLRAEARWHEGSAESLQESDTGGGRKPGAEARNQTGPAGLWTRRAAEFADTGRGIPPGVLVRVRCGAVAPPSGRKGPAGLPVAQRATLYRRPGRVGSARSLTALDTGCLTNSPCASDSLTFHSLKEQMKRTSHLNLTLGILLSTVEVTGTPDRGPQSW